MIALYFLLKKGLAFRRHNESKDSSNRRNFLERLRILINQNESIHASTFDNAAENLQMTSNKIKKYVVSCAAVENINIFIKEMNDFFYPY